MLAAIFLLLPPTTLDFTGRVEAVPPPVLVAVTGGPLASAARATIGFDVDERSFLTLRRQGKVVVAFGLADEGGFPHAAVLAGVAPAVDPKTGTIRFRATVSSPDEVLMSGMFIRVRLTLPK